MAWMTIERVQEHPNHVSSDLKRWGQSELSWTYGLCRSLPTGLIKGTSLVGHGEGNVDPRDGIRRHTFIRIQGPLGGELFVPCT